MQFTSMILSNVEVSPGYWRMRMTAPAEFASARPGQFVMVRVNGAIDPLLRRPFGIFDVGTYTPAQSGAVAAAVSGDAVPGGGEGDRHAVNAAWYRSA